MDAIANSIDTYNEEVPARDAWGTPFRYVKMGNQSFQIISAGSDRKFDEKSWSVGAHTHDFAADAVYLKSGPDRPGTFHRIWIDALGAPLATSTEEMKAATENLVREETAKMRGMSEEESRSYLAASATQRTMKALAMLIGAYKVKTGSYPHANSITDLARILLPDSALDVQKTDWWGTEFRYQLSTDGKTYTLASAGRDRTFDPVSWDQRGPLATTDDDAVVRNGEFIRVWGDRTRPGLSDAARKRAKLQPAARALAEHAEELHNRNDDIGALASYIQAVQADPAAADLATIRRYSSIGTYRLVAVVPPPPPANLKREEQTVDKANTTQIAALRQYLQIHANDFEATKDLAILVDLPEAESLLEPVFKSRPRDPELYAMRASLRARNHQVDGALNDEARAAELDPQNPERYYQIAVLTYEAVAKEKLSADQKRTLIRRGLTALGRAEVLKPDYTEALAYHNLLLRQEALLESDPAAQKKRLADADAIRQGAIDAAKHRKLSAGQTGPFKVGGEVSAPVPLDRVEPVLPEAARSRGIYGIVILELIIDKTGHVTRATVLKPLPFGADEAALAAVKQWTFRPATRNGEPVDAIFNVTVRMGTPPVH